MWKYDKRFFVDPAVALRVPLIDPLPPFAEGKWRFIEGAPVTRAKHESIAAMVDQMNKGIKTLKDLTAES